MSLYGCKTCWHSTGNHKESEKTEKNDGAKDMIYATSDVYKKSGLGWTRLGRMMREKILDHSGHIILIRDLGVTYYAGFCYWPHSKPDPKPTPWYENPTEHASITSCETCSSCGEDFGRAAGFDLGGWPSMGWPSICFSCVGTLHKAKEEFLRSE